MSQPFNSNNQSKDANQPGTQAHQLESTLSKFELTRPSTTNRSSLDNLSFRSDADLLRSGTQGSTSIRDVPQGSNDVFEYRFGFKIGSLALLHDGSTTVEVVDTQAITSLPNTENWLRGLTSIRGNLIPVFDLSLYLAQSQENTVSLNRSGRRFLIFGEGQRIAILIIDSLPQQLRVDPMATYDSDVGLPPLLQPYEKQKFRANDEQWVQIDFDRLFVALGESVSTANLSA